MACATNADDDGQQRADPNRLPGCGGSAAHIVFADAARNHGGQAHAQADRQAVKYRDQCFGDADSSDRVGAKTGDESDVNDGENRFHRHFQHHWNCEQAQCASCRAGREVFRIVA